MPHLSNVKQLLVDASVRRFRERQSAARSLDEYTQALLIHVNEVAAALRDGEPPRGRVFRVGLAYVSEDRLVVPVPFRRKRPGSLFMDEFHVMPLRATSLGPLLEHGRGDRIDDLEAHLATRGVSLSTQVALREGVRSNVRLPWRSLDRRGFLWFSADVPRFFDDALFQHLESLVPEVELQLRLLDLLEPLLPMGGRPRALEGNRPALERLGRLLDVEDNPLPGRLELDWHPPREDGVRLVNLWKAGSGAVLLCALECEGEAEAALRLLLTVRGWCLQQASRARHPARVMEGVEEQVRQFRAAGALPLPAVVRSLGLALLHPGTRDGGGGHVDVAGVGESRLWWTDGTAHRRLAADSRPLGEGGERQAQVERLEPGQWLVLEQGGRNDALVPAAIRLRIGFAAG
jgi:hypothetical protein